MSYRRLRPGLAVLLAWTACASWLSSQASYRVAHPVEIPRTWTVNASGGADFTDLPQAVATARSGDVLLVAPGNYTAFTLQGKGLTILGDGSPLPQVRNRPVISGIPAGEEVILHSMFIQGLDQGALRLESNAGTVWIESCVLDQGTSSGAMIVDCASVVFVRSLISRGSTFQSGPAFATSALQVVHSAVHAWQSDFLGKNVDSGTFLLVATPGGHGASYLGSFLYAAGCLFSGGRGQKAFCNVVMMTCTSGANGGTGFQSQFAEVPPITLSSVFEGGPGGSGVSCFGFLNCPGGSPGPATTGTLTQEDLPLRSYELSSPVRSGTSYQLTADCEPGEFVWSVFSDRLDPVYIPNYFGTQVGALPVELVFEGVADGTGSLVKSVPIPPLAGMTSFERLYAQGLFFDEFNNAYLGSPSVLVVVN